MREIGREDSREENTELHLVMEESIRKITSVQRTTGQNETAFFSIQLSTRTSRYEYY